MVDLEMKLQMASEEIAASLEEQSSAALLRVPRATRDVIRLRDDAVSLRSAVSGILQKLKKVCIYSMVRVYVKNESESDLAVFNLCFLVLGSDAFHIVLHCGGKNYHLWEKD